MRFTRAMEIECHETGVHEAGVALSIEHVSPGAGSPSAGANTVADLGKAAHRNCQGGLGLVGRVLQPV
jgi:hypothetical protein